MGFNPDTDWDIVVTTFMIGDRVHAFRRFPDGFIITVEDPDELSLVCLSADPPIFTQFTNGTATVRVADWAIGELWLRLGALNQWRKITEWGDTSALLRHDDMPIA
jgi:hypothetical protein